MKNILIAALFLLPAIVGAEPYHITVPGQGWNVTLDLPRLESQEGVADTEGFQFRAHAFNGFNVSLYVEPRQSAEKTHESCREFYWSNMSKNPLIDHHSIKRDAGDMFAAVGYAMTIELEGQKYTMPNENLFFYFKDKCVDVHVSKLPFSESDAGLFETVRKSLRYGTF